MDRVSPSRRKTNLRLLVGCGALALAASAHAQSFQATGSFAQGTGSIATGPGATTINLNQAATIIDWQPGDTNSPTINFQPAGTGALFRNTPGIVIPDFTVLNRILPVDNGGNPVNDRVIGINGFVFSQFFPNAGGPGITAGRIWFYTPGGFLIGPQAQFNTDSLVLSTSVIDPASVFVGPNGQIRFTGTPNPASAIRFQQGVNVQNITATVDKSSYVAMVAPRVEMAGTARVDGSIAYVAAEAANITISQGLFDIQVLTGTGDPNGVVHTGSTTGPATTPIFTPVFNPDNQNVYAVAVPKNQALTMLLGGRMGYTPAASVTLEAGKVVLSAGHDVAGGIIAGTPNPTSNAAANIQFTGNVFQSDTFATGNGFVRFDQGTGALQFQQDATIRSSQSTLLRADGAAQITVAGNLTIDVNGNGAGRSATLSATNGGSVIVDGTSLIDASGRGFDDFSPNGNGGPGNGGVAEIVAAGGSVTLNGTGNFLGAIGFAGTGQASNGSATGGTARVQVSNGGSFTAPDLQVNASAEVNPGQFGVPTVSGGNSFGGQVRVESTGGTLTIGTLNAFARSFAGSVTTGIAGTASQGRIDVLANGGSLTFTNTSLDTSMRSGSAQTGGTDGSTSPASNGVFVTSDGPASRIQLGDTLIFASASGQFGSTGGALVTGGNVSLLARSQGVLDIASAVIGALASSGPAQFATPSGATSVIGGNVSILSRSGTMTLGGLDVSTGGFGGSGSQFGANATGGRIGIQADDLAGGPGTINITGPVFLSANGQGGSAPQAGSGTGGFIQITAQGGALNFTDTTQVSRISATGFAGGSDPGSPSPVGAGGDVTVELFGSFAPSAITMSRFEIRSDGRADDDVEGFPRATGDGGTGIGGAVNFNLQAGNLTSNELIVAADGIGGNGAIDSGNGPGQGGNGTGGNANFALNGANADLGSLVVSAAGLGGTGVPAAPPNNPGLPGNGFGGNATVDILSGTLVADSVTVTASGTGGGRQYLRQISGDVDFDRPSRGGNGTGGFARFTLDGGDVTINQNALVAADGFGGDAAIGRLAGSDGGNGTGGTATFQILSGTGLFAPTVDVSASANGGAGSLVFGSAAAGNGGNGFAGTATFSGLADIFTIDSVTILGTSAGGAGGTSGTPQFDPGTGAFLGFSSINGNGGSGGDGTGGSANYFVDTDPVLASLIVDTSGIGGAGANGIVGGAGGSGFGGTGGAGSRLVLTFGDLTITDANIISNGTGGTGGNSLGPGNRGARGGNGFAGSATILVDGLGANLIIDNLVFEANGVGGLAGTGTAALAPPPPPPPAPPPPPPPVNGGDGGDATGGTLLFQVSNGATFQANSLLQWRANATGGDGTNGFDGGLVGLGGGALAGSVDLLVDSGGSFTDNLNGLNIESIGNPGFGISGFSSGGPVTLTHSDASPTPGELRLGSLNITTLGGGGAPVTLNADEASIEIGTGPAVLNVTGDINFNANGDGQILIGNSDLFANAFGQIFVTHTGRPNGLATVEASSITMNATFGIDQQAGSLMRATNTLNRPSRLILSAPFGPVNADNLEAIDLIQAEAGLDLTANRAVTTGAVANVGGNPQGGNILLRAGYAGANFGGFTRNQTAILNGPLTATGEIRVESGGDILASGGANLSSNHNIAMLGIDDIRLLAGARLNSALGPVAGARADISLNAGGLASPNFNPANFTSSLIANGAILTAANNSIALIGEAIDARTISANATTLTADVIGAPPVGAPLDNDGGQLSPGCEKGNICLGALNVAGTINVGGTGLPNILRMSGNVTAQNLGLRARDQLDLGPVVTLTGTNTLDLFVTQGSLTLAPSSNLIGGAVRMFAGSGIFGGGTVTGTTLGIGAPSVSIDTVNLADTFDTILADGSVFRGTVLAVNGPVRIGNLQGGAPRIEATTIDIGQASANSITLNATGNVTTGNLNATSGGIRIDSLANIATGNLASALDLELRAIGGAFNYQVATSGGSISFGSATSGRDLRFEAFLGITGNTVNVGRNGALLARGATLLTGDALAFDNLDVYGSSISLQNVRLTLPDSYTTINSTNGPLSLIDVASGGMTLVSEGGGMTVRDLTSTSPLGSGTDIVDVNALGGPLVARNITAGGDVLLIASGGANIAGPVTAGGDVELDGTLGSQPWNFASSITAGNDVIADVAGALNAPRVVAGRNFDISADGGIRFDSAAAGGNATLFSSAGDVLVGTPGNAGGGLVVAGTVDAQGNNVTLNGSQSLTITRASARAGNVNISAGDADVALAEASGDIVISASRNARLGSVSTRFAAQNLQVLAGNNGAIDGNVTVAGNATLDVDGLATLGGTLDARAIVVNSSDVAIGPAARIGGQGGTDSAAFTNTGANVTHIGGNGGTGTYGMSEAEVQRIFANNITIAEPIRQQVNQRPQAIDNTAPDAILDTLAFTGSTGRTGNTAGNVGANGTFAIQINGKLRTVGTVRFNNASNNNRFAIDATRAIELDAATGSIAMTDANGGLAGTLRLTSDDVIAATRAAQTDVIAAATLGAINDRLGTNDGPVNDAGYFQANAMVVNVANGFYVQNSGANSQRPRIDFAGRRGLTVGPGGLTINTPNANARIVINGRQANSTGGFVTGIDFLRLVTIPNNLFDALSTINGCAIANPNGCFSNDPLIDNADISRDLIGDIEEGQGGNAMPLIIVELKDQEEPGFPPLIDDPVTGAPNEDLWTGDEDKCDPSTQDCKPGQ